MAGPVPSPSPIRPRPVALTMLAVALTRVLVLAIWCRSSGPVPRAAGPSPGGCYRAAVGVGAARGLCASRRGSASASRPSIARLRCADPGSRRRCADSEGAPSDDPARRRRPRGSRSRGGAAADPLASRRPSRRRRSGRVSAPCRSTSTPRRRSARSTPPSVRVRRRLPRDLPLSMTALASWCAGDTWIEALPVDEAVPMLSRWGRIAPRSPAASATTRRSAIAAAAGLRRLDARALGRVPLAARPTSSPISPGPSSRRRPPCGECSDEACDAGSGCSRRSVSRWL